MHRRIFPVWLSVCSGLLCLSIAACGPQVKVLPTEPVATPQAPEKIKVVVLRLENATRKGRVDASTPEDRLWGSGIRAQIVKALEQTNRVAVVTHSGPREVLQRGLLTVAGDISEQVRARLGSFGDAELIVAGALSTYQLSKESKNAGAEADLLFQETQAKLVALDGIGETAKRVFGNIKPAGSDRIAIELWLFDAKNGKRVAITRIEGTPSDSTEVMATPMQQAMRGGANKAASWITETHAAFRAGTLAPPAVLPVVKKSSEPTLEPRQTIVAPPPPTPTRLPRANRSGATSVEKVEKNLPAPPSPVASEEDWASPPSRPAGGAAKTPPRDPEEWGEK
ncbi:MAG: hypothetical protein FJ147_14270 [Deltaproteobacteria bacterium]|nr:hypothetical protein [Deltaproteobacteria bacterium]